MLNLKNLGRSIFYLLVSVFEIGFLHFVDDEEQAFDGRGFQNVELDSFVKPEKAFFPQDFLRAIESARVLPALVGDVVLVAGQLNELVLLQSVPDSRDGVEGENGQGFAERPAHRLLAGLLELRLLVDPEILVT